MNPEEKRKVKIRQIENDKWKDIFTFKGPDRKKYPDGTARVIPKDMLDKKRIKIQYGKPGEKMPPGFPNVFPKDFHKKMQRLNERTNAMEVNAYVMEIEHYLFSFDEI